MFPFLLPDEIDIAYCVRLEAVAEADKAASVTTRATVCMSLLVKALIGHDHFERDSTMSSAQVPKRASQAVQRH